MLGRPCGYFSIGWKFIAASFGGILALLVESSMVACLGSDSAMFTGTCLRTNRLNNNGSMYTLKKLYATVEF